MNAGDERLPILRTWGDATMPWPPRSRYRPPRPLGPIRRWFSRLPGFWAAALLAGGLLYFLLVIPENSYRGLLLIGYSFAIGCLLGLWTTQGRWSTPWRIVLVIAFLTFWERWEILGGTRTGGMIFTMMCGTWPSIMVFLPLHWLGMELHRRDKMVKPSSWMQFSLATLFQWVVAMALGTALLTWFPWQEKFGGKEMLWYRNTMIQLADIQIMFIAGGWLGLGKSSSSMRIFFFSACLMFLVLQSIPYVFEGYSKSLSSVQFMLFMRDLSNLSQIFVQLIFWQIAGFLLLRLFGYEIVWRRRVVL